MDKLSSLLQNLDMNAEVFFSGSLCGIQAFDDCQDAGFLHLLESGSLTVTTEQGHKVLLEAGSVMFFPSGTCHQLEVEASEDANLVCATVRLPAHHQRILTDNLPKFLCINIEDDKAATDTACRIFDEAFNEQNGRQIMIDRLCDIFVIHLLRYVIDSGTLELGLLAAESHPQLAKLIDAIKETPEHEWSVEDMAEQVAMSRSKFAALFKETVGQSPMEYVTGLRMAMAKGLLKMNRPVGLVANEVGYENASSLAKVFRKHFGITPKQWLKQYLGGKQS